MEINEKKHSTYEELLSNKNEIDYELLNQLSREDDLLNRLSGEDPLPEDEAAAVNAETLAVSYTLMALIEMMRKESFGGFSRDAVRHAISIYDRDDIRKDRTEVTRDCSVGDYEITLRISDRGRISRNGRISASDYLREDIENSILDRIMVTEIIDMRKI